MTATNSSTLLAIRTDAPMFDEQGCVLPQDNVSVRTIDLGAASAEVVDVGPEGASFRHRYSGTRESTLIDFWIPVSGGLSLDQAGRGVSIGIDEFVTATRRNAYDLTVVGPSRLVLISIPYEKLDIDPCGIDAMSAQNSSGREAGVTALLAQIATFAEFLAELSFGTAVRYGYHLVEMISILTQEMFAHCQTYQTQVRAQTLHRIQAWAKGRLSDPNLSIAMMARAHNVSVRYVQKLFKEHGESPNRWIRNQRLAGCWNDLQDVRNSELTVAMIGRRWGFCNLSYFTRVFRERYGVTPAACRSALSGKA